MSNRESMNVIVLLSNWVSLDDNVEPVHDGGLQAGI